MSRRSRLIDDLNYNSDPRVSASRRGSWFDDFDEQNMRCLITVWDYSSGDSEEICGWIPVEYRVCDLCNGRGRHTNPSIDASGLSRDDFDADPQFEEDYRRGLFDVRCYQCNGRRVVPTPVEVYLSEEQEKLLRLLREKLEDEAMYAAEVAAERRWGC